MPTLDALRAQLLGKPATTEEQPFGPDALVFKVLGKMFALVAWELNPMHLTVKCDPTLAPLLRAQYPSIQPGYHMSKAHWNTITLDGTIPDEELWEMIEESYDLVCQGLTRAQRASLGTGA